VFGDKVRSRANSKTAAECIEAAFQCEHEAILSEDDLEQETLLRLAATWLELAQYRAEKEIAASRSAAADRSIVKH
jgi:hypothetical protein